MRLITSVAAAAVLLLGGCDKVKEVAGQVKTGAASAAKQVGEAAGEAVDSAKEKLGEKTQEASAAVDTDGAFRLQIDGPLTTAKCFATLAPGVAGRPALLQVRSYDTAEPSYPAALLHAAVDDAQSLQSLAGRTIEARMFVQDEDGAVWDNVDGGLVTWQIESVDGQELEARLVSGQLTSSQGGAAVDVTGSLTAQVSK